MARVAIPAELEPLVRQCRRDFERVSTAWVHSGVHSLAEIEDMRTAIRGIFAGETGPAERDEATRYVCALFARLAAGLPKEGA